MTNIECLHQAGREIGLSEEEMDNRTKATIATNPALLAVMHREVPLDEQPDKIETYKQCLKLLEDMPKGERDALAAEFTRRRTQNN